MKAHIRISATGIQLLCGANIYTTSGYAVLRDQFMAQSSSFRCKRCERKLHDYKPPAHKEQTAG